MLGYKAISPAKTVSLILILALIITLVLVKNNQAVMRVMVGQEVNLRTAGFNEITTEHFIIKYTPADEDYIDTIAEASEKSFEEVTGLFGYTPKTKTTIVVYPDTESLAQSFGWNKNEKAMGVYWAGTIRILSPSQWVTGQMEDEFYKEGPMVHELAHLMVDDLTNGNYSRWWTEGIAQYVEKKITGFEFSKPFKEGQSVDCYSMKELEKNFDQLDQSVVYWQSLKVVEYIADNYGEDKLYTILNYLGQGNNMASAVEKALAVDYDIVIGDFYSNLLNNN